MAFHRVAASPFFRPAEWARHSHCILAWPGLNNPTISTPGSLAAATSEVSALARTISEFEPVTLIVGKERLDQAREVFGSSRLHAGKYKVNIHPVQEDDVDLWMRDIAPTFTVARKQGKAQNQPFGGANGQHCQLVGVDFNFNGWGNRHPTPGTVRLAKVLLNDTNVPREEASITTEGGALEVDGDGTLLVTESSIINENRNTGKTKEEVEESLRRYLGVSKVIWIPGVGNADSTDCHIDALARFARPGLVLLSRPAGPRAETVWKKVYKETREILLKELDAHGRNLEVIDIVEPDMECLGLDEETMGEVRKGGERSPVMSYVNYYMPNGGLVVPKFGDHVADTKAYEVLRDVFSGKREMKQVYINELPLLGGGVHCATQQVPLIT